jgi:hypothetical protein
MPKSAIELPLDCLFAGDFWKARIIPLLPSSEALDRRPRGASF